MSRMVGEWLVGIQINVGYFRYEQDGELVVIRNIEYSITISYMSRMVGGLLYYEVFQI